MKKRFPPIAILLALLATIAFSLTASAEAPDHIWHTFDHLDGVDANWVFDIAQTPDGALWFATDNGVLRFDGVWEQVNAGLPSEMALTMLVDNAGALWVGTAHGLARRAEDGWEVQGAGTELANARINALLAMPDGAIWAGGEAGVFVRAQADDWRRVAGLPLPGVDAMALDAGENVWLAQADRLFKYDGSDWREMSLTGADDADGFAITDLAADETGGMWVATQARGVAHLSDDEIVWETTVGGLPSDRVLALALASDGSLWAGTNGGGVGRLGPDGWRTLTIRDGLAADFVSALFQDRDGVFWFGTVAGVSRYADHIWRTWPDAPQGGVSTLAADAAGGVVWAGAIDGGLYRLQDDLWQRVKLKARGRPVSLRFIQTLFVDDVGDLWIGTQDSGVVHFDGKRARLLTAADGLAEDFVTAIVQTSDGAMWFGSAASGLSRWDGESWRIITRADGLISDEITALLADGETLWVGTRAGLSYYDGAVWRSFTAEDGLGADEITALARDESGAIWAGTWGGGVSVWQDGVWRTFDARSGLLAPGVEALLSQSGQMWVGAVSGLSVYDGRSWQHFSHAYGYDVGRVYALAGGETGSVFVGGDEGVMRYAPDGGSPALQVVSVNGQTPQAGEVTVLTDSELHIMFQGRDTLSLPDELLYLYQLEGVDADWRQSRTATAVYPPLARGDYVLRAQVRDANMNYSQPVLITLHVRRANAFIWAPGVGRVRSEFALIGVIFLTLFAAVIGYASWSTAVRWHMRQQAVEQRFNPYIAGSPIRSRDMFYGRDELLQNAEAGLAHNSLMIHGERRIGKTSILYQMLDDLRQLQDDRFKFFPVFVDLEGTPEPVFFHHLMEGLLDALHDDLVDFPAEEKLQYHLVSDDTTYTDRHMRRDLRQIVAYLKRRHARTPRIVFLLDEADILSSYSSLTQQQLRRILQDTFARNVGVVIAGVHISKAWDRVESPWYNMFIEMVAPPFNRYESELLMREPVYGFYEWEEEAVRFVWQRSGGRPHRIQQIAREAVNLMLDDHRRRITLVDVHRAYERIVFAETH
jgi:ligand-binding sensor domain-containing protein